MPFYRVRVERVETAVAEIVVEADTLENARTQAENHAGSLYYAEFDPVTEYTILGTRRAKSREYNPHQPTTYDDTWDGIDDPDDPKCEKGGDLAWTWTEDASGTWRGTAEGVEGAIVSYDPKHGWTFACYLDPSHPNHIAKELTELYDAGPVLDANEGKFLCQTFADD